MPNERRRLSDHGLRSERLLWPRSGASGKGPSVFEEEVAASVAEASTRPTTHFHTGCAGC